MFDQAGIDRERGIVLSEWRLHLGAGERTQDKIRRVQGVVAVHDNLAYPPAEASFAGLQF